METAIYGSEFVATKTATEQIMDLRNTLRYLGVPIINKAYMFGETNLWSQAQSYMLAYQTVGEAIAAKIIEFHWCLSNQNRSEISSKH